MPEIKTTNGGWNRFLASLLWAIFIAFATGCVGGYLLLDGKIAQADEKAKAAVGAAITVAQDNKVQLAQLQECVVNIKEKIVDQNVKIKIQGDKLIEIDKKIDLILHTIKR